MRRAESTLSCLMAVDKPTGPSSHDVVSLARRALGERRIGHAGTLDPAASGVLVLGIGQATRLLGHLSLDDKTYEATIEFGSQTTTDDAEGEVMRTAEVPEQLSDTRQAAAYLASLVGSREQVPPQYSAISKGGQRAYALARAGRQIDLEPRPITIYGAELQGVEHDGPLRWRCRFHVSKGTYVRSIARDIGLDLGTAAHLASLRRVSSGLVSVQDCVSCQELRQEGRVLCETRRLDPVRALALAIRNLSGHEMGFVSQGRRIACGEVRDLVARERRAPREAERVALVYAGKLVGIWERQGPQLKSVCNLPQGVEGVR